MDINNVVRGVVFGSLLVGAIASANATEQEQANNDYKEAQLLAAIAEADTLDEQSAANAIFVINRCMVDDRCKSVIINNVKFDIK